MRYCDVCGIEFNPVNNSQIYCKKCSMLLKRRRYNEWYNKNKRSEKIRYKGRFSGKEYENSPEKLQAIKRKYRNGVTIGHINQMLGIEK